MYNGQALLWCYKGARWAHTIHRHNLHIPASFAACCCHTIIPKLHENLAYANIHTICHVSQTQHKRIISGIHYSTLEQCEKHAKKHVEQVENV